MPLARFPEATNDRPSVLPPDPVDDPALFTRIWRERSRSTASPWLVGRAGDSILHAIETHDDGWAEEDAAPTVRPDTGTVVDFISAPVSVRQSTRRCAGAWGLEEDAWAAALVAQHRLTVYGRFRPDAEWTSFFAEVEAARGAWLRASGGSLEELGVDYAFLRIGDLISLAFCTGWTDEHRFGEWAVQLHGTRVVVTPDVFGWGLARFPSPSKRR